MGGFEGDAAATQDDGKRAGPWLWQGWPCGAAAAEGGRRVNRLEVTHAQHAMELVVGERAVAIHVHLAEEGRDLRHRYVVTQAAHALGELLVRRRVRVRVRVRVRFRVRVRVRARVRVRVRVIGEPWG